MKHLWRAVTVTALIVVAATGFASPALAHVEVSGIDTTQGGSGVLTFRVPTESDTASTTELLVTLPDSNPILSVATQPKAGWTATVTKKNLPSPQKDEDGNIVTQYVSQVDWKADNPQAAIPPNQFDMFSISAGPLPKQDSLTLPALQTYSDGHTVNWNEVAATGQAQPDHPAPVLTLTTSSTDTNAAPSSNAAQAGPTWPGIVALIIAIIAALLGLANLVLLRRRS
ncbi:MAG TPA: YcnI family protein [Mycobacterium sp.]|nr:YcnI family protein [Mycobacterium sp.]